MVYLMWIYSFGTIIANLFVVIYIYKLNESINELIIYAILNYTFIFVGFSIVGFFMALFRKNIKYLFIFSYIIFILSFLSLLIFGESINGIYLYGILYGFGMGMYWNAVHTQELYNIENKNRDFYSSSISLGKNLLQIIVPFLVSIIFFVGNFLSYDGYTVLFCMLPIAYIISFKFINQIGDYVPDKIVFKDVKNFFNFEKYKYGHLYFLFDGLKFGIEIIIIPIITLYILKTEINIGIFQGILALISTFIIIHFSFKRNESNRFKYYMIFGLLFSLNFLLLVVNFNIYGFIMFSLLNLILMPLFRISRHVYDLSLMDNIKTDVSDFYPAMIFRDATLYVGRIIGLFILYFLANNYNFTEVEIYKGGLIFVALMIMCLILSIYLWEKHEK